MCVYRIAILNSKYTIANTYNVYFMFIFRVSVSVCCSVPEQNTTYILLHQSLEQFWQLSTWIPMKKKRRQKQTVLRCNLYNFQLAKHTFHSNEDNEEQGVIVIQTESPSKQPMRETGHQCNVMCLFYVGLVCIVQFSICTFRLVTVSNVWCIVFHILISYTIILATSMHWPKFWDKWMISITVSFAYGIYYAIANWKLDKFKLWQAILRTIRWNNYKSVSIRFIVMSILNSI